ncbi:substrate-binding domain-containing protein [Tersicoccus sp. MR15.9]|uniref:substrate-binding domain-containing protein n=1 Tax=Tersicoccus mangrovi TaxID=3121635 RepID=UPI002FE5900D
MRGSLEALISRLVSYGVSVPGEMSVVGFDDISVAGMLHPALTTVHMPMEEAGRQAVKRLVRLITDEPDDPHVLPTHLVVRSTTGRPVAS